MGARVTIKELPTIGRRAQEKWHLEFLVIESRYHRPSDAREMVFWSFWSSVSYLWRILAHVVIGGKELSFWPTSGVAWGLGLLSVVLCQRLSGSSNLSREVQGSMCTVSPKKGGGNLMRLEVGSMCYVRSYNVRLLSVVSRERLGEGKRKQGQGRVAQ